MRDVWVAAITQTDLRASSPQEMCRRFVERMERFAPMRPDLYCLPEAFPFVNLDMDRPPGPEAAEVAGEAGGVVEHFATFARTHRAWVVCPTYTRDAQGRAYNAAVVLDRDGAVAGEYRKAHLTEDEIEGGLTPGPLTQPAFATDFGTFGVQICFDIEWSDGWKSLQAQRAEIVVWPSAFAGGDKLNQLAVNHHYAIAASTRKGSSRIVDLDGRTVAASGIWDPAGVCAPLNLDQAFLHTYPHQEHFDAIRARWGRDVLIRTFHDEEWTVIESRAPGLPVTEILAAFDIPTHDEMIERATALQQARRPAEEPTTTPVVEAGIARGWG